MTTLEELGELWCDVWMRELERGTAVDALVALDSCDMYVQLGGITLNYSDSVFPQEGYRRVCALELLDDDGRLPDFTLEIDDGVLRGSLAIHDRATAANPWDDAAEGLRKMLEAS